MKENIRVIQYCCRANPNVGEQFRAELKSSGIQSDVEYHRHRAQAFIVEINEFLQGFRVFCASTHKDSERMWAEYAEKHRGVSLRIQPNITKDSKFQHFRPITYQEKRSPLYADTLEFCSGSLFGNQDARIAEIIERIIYTKTMDWQYESEYRLAIPIMKDEEPWNTLTYHPEEITELYLGLEMQGPDAEDIVSKALIVNPEISIFQAKRDGSGKLVFDKL